MTDPYRACLAELLSKIDYTWGDIPADVRDLMDHARALLAKPVAEGPTDEDVFDLCEDLGFEMSNFEESAGILLEMFRAVLARWGRPTLQPVAVSERLPRPEDCLDEGWAWFFNKRIGWRQAVLPVSPGYTHWLPANALPAPEAQ